MSERFDPLTSPLGEVGDVLLVAASAGTGKTWTITHLAARWLLEEDRSTSELLMVTFSRAAAGELKSRLRSRVEEIGRTLARWDAARDLAPLDVTDEPPWARALAGVVDRVGADEFAARHRRVLATLDDVHARTIHSFAAAARQEPEDEVTDGANLRRRAVQEVITRRITTREPDFLATLDALESTARGAGPAAVGLAERLVRALGASESAGGLRAGRVHLEREVGEDTDPALLDVVESMLVEATDRLADLRSLERTTSFDELIEQLHAEVTAAGSVTAARLRSQFGLVLIDEFQDTDALQWEIFDAVFRTSEPAVPMIVVGDPKQAIYGFRGGDPSVFQRVTHLVRHPAPGSRRSFETHLTTNYRAAEGVLAATNALFGAGDAAGWRFSGGDADELVDYEPVEPSPGHRDRPGHVEVRRAVGTFDESSLFDDVTGVLTQLRDEYGVAAGDVVVLCRRRSTIERLQRHLERRGVRTVSSGTAPVLLSRAATQVRTLLWVMAGAEDPRRANLMAATWFHPLGASAAASLADTLRARGLAALHRRVTPADVLHGVLAGPEGERDWTDLEHLFELLEGALAGPVPAERALGHLDRAVAGARDDADAAEGTRRRIESDGDAVQLLTIHAAKGLEFPVVLVPEIESTWRAPGLATWTTPAARVIDSASLLGRGTPGGPAGRAQDAEDRRLIYVALTRAERAMFLWRAREEGQWPPLLDALGDAEAAGVRLADYGDPVRLTEGLELARPPRPALTAPDVLAAPALVERWRRWSYSALRLAETVAVDDDRFDARDLDEDADREGSAIEPGPLEPAPAADPHFAELFDSLSGAVVGVAVHRVFETIVGHVRGSDVTAVREAVRSAWAEAGLATPSEQVTATFSRLLARPLGPLFDGASLDDLVGRGASASEMRFTLPLSTGGCPPGDRLARLGAALAGGDPHGAYLGFFEHLARTGGHDQLLEGHLTGSIDLVAALGPPGRERYVIVDYKTNLLHLAASYEPVDLIVEMAASGYPLQGLLYAVALHRFLRGRLADYDPASHLGGLGYYYVRGAARPLTSDSGLAVWRPPAAVVVAASEILDGLEP